MTDEKDERKRTHLRLVVDNVEKRLKRPAGSEEVFVPLETLAAQNEHNRGDFYSGLNPSQVKSYQRLESFLAGRQWLYGLDPHHGKMMVLNVATFSQEMAEYGGGYADEALVYVVEDPSGRGLCLSMETILPFYSEDDAIMEEALLYGPMLPYGTLFLEENRQDGFLDLIYRLAFPLEPPLLTAPLIEKFFRVAGYELKEVLLSLTESQEP